MKVFPERYPWFVGADFDSDIKSLWLGWWLVTWSIDPDKWYKFVYVDIAFQPGL